MAFGLGKKLLDLVSADDTPPKEAIPTPASSGVVESFTTLPGELNTTVLEKFDSATILDIVEKLAQNDSYTKFQDQCRALGAFISDETALFKAALASLQSAGVTLEQIRSDIRKRQSLLQRVELQFKQSLDTKRQLLEKTQQALQSNTQQVKVLEGEITSLENSKREKQKRIEQVMESSQSLTGKMTQIQQEMTDRTTEFQKTVGEVQELWQNLLIGKLSNL